MSSLRSYTTFIQFFKRLIRKFIHKVKNLNSYSLYNQIYLISLKARTDALRQAIFEYVKPGDVVVDIGTGSGILAIFACQTGTKKVYAIERDPIIKIAKQLAKSNNFEDKISFIYEDSRYVKLPQKADVIISETIGVTEFEEEILSILLDAKKIP